MCYLGFPIGFHLPQIEVQERIFNVINKVIEKDMQSIKSFKTDTKPTIYRILIFLALKKPGETSDAKIASHLDVPMSSVRNILNVLEKTHLIFSLKPYGCAGKILKKSWKYYFLSSSINTAIRFKINGFERKEEKSSSINAAIRFKIGKYDQKDSDMLGVLTETLVASYFFRMKETINQPLGIFYDPEKRGVDFLLQDTEGNVIPIEVGIGNKSSLKTKNSIKLYGSNHGIVVSNISKIKKQDNVIFIPLRHFLFS